jgi:transcriptional regulator with XRE-family HTH domain
MGFRENLKKELSYSGMLVKELSAKTGINKYTLDNYLSTHNCTPSADAAVKIARALGVSVEYLITGQVTSSRKTIESLTPETRSLIPINEKLCDDNRKIILTLAKALKSVEQTRHES